MIIFNKIPVLLKQKIKIFLFSALFGCSTPFVSEKQESIKIYDCDAVDMFFYESDSTQVLIYSFPGPFNFYKDSTVIDMIGKGILQPRHIYKAMNLVQEKPSNMGKWIEEKIVYPEISKHKSDKCFKEIPDSNSTIIEVIKTHYKGRNEFGEIYPFEITFSYGTDHACFDIQIIDEKKIRIRHTGWIL